ncbi:probable G-protein coupled receptor 21 [Lytechinus variegatus]|uniref:probable G-protein coupled receptor 21 n=1 Tax=Lytechinus variegatus TaxID=7654 RepID=UPI001BB131AD|nr:probable G-protein coupled receptor 21 [Lytechinus variegatus]
MWILTLSCIDRFIAVSRPLRYYVILPRRRFKILIMIITLVAILNSITSFTHSKVEGVCNPYAGVCSSGIRPTFVIYTVFPICGVVLTIYSNVCLLWITRKHRRQIAAQRQSVNVGNSSDTPPTSSTKGVKTVLIITAAFYISWIPSTIFGFSSAITMQQVSPYTTIALRYLIICQSWWNAVIYWFIKPPYRRVLIGLFLRLTGRGNGPTPHSDTSAQSYMS